MIIHADAITISRCGDPNCKSIHIDLLASDEQVIACAALGVEDVRSFTEKMRSVAYEIATENPA
jgi:hypothetical protein